MGTGVGAAVRRGVGTTVGFAVGTGVSRAVGTAVGFTVEVGRAVRAGVGSAAFGASVTEARSLGDAVGLSDADGLGRPMVETAPTPISKATPITIFWVRDALVHAVRSQRIGAPFTFRGSVGFAQPAGTSVARG